MRVERCEFCKREAPYLNEIHVDGGAFLVCDYCKAAEQTSEEGET